MRDREGPRRRVGDRCARCLVEARRRGVGSEHVYPPASGVAQTEVGRLDVGEILRRRCHDDGVRSARMRSEGGRHARGCPGADDHHLG